MHFIECHYVNTDANTDVIQLLCKYHYEVIVDSTAADIDNYTLKTTP